MTSSESPAKLQWQRVSPIATFYFLLGMLQQAVNLWYLFIPVIAGGDWIQDIFWNYLIYAIAIFALLGLFIQYWFFRFCIEHDSIHIRTGLFNRSRLTLNFERVQQADIVQPFYFRPFGLATLGLESAGSTAKEVSLPGISYKRAVELKQKILEYKRNQGQISETTSESNGQTTLAKVQADDPSYRLFLSPAEIARYGLMHNGLFFLLPLIAPLTQNPQLFQTYLRPLENTWLFDYLFHADHQDSLFSFIAALFFLCTIAIVLLFLLSIAVALFRFWNYELQRVGDQFQYRAGLATIKTRGFRLHKLQKVVVTQGWVARLLQRSTLSMTKAGANFSHDNHAHADKLHFLIPVLNNEELRRFIAQLQLPTPQWRPVSRYLIVSSGLFWSLLLGTAAAFLTWKSLITAWWVFLVIILVFLIAWRRWHCWGVYHDDEWLAIKTGFIGQRIVFVPAPKTQKMIWQQPLWLRRHRLAYLTIYSGAGPIAIPAINAQWAQSIRDSLLWQVTQYRKRWF